MFLPAFLLQCLFGFLPQLYSRRFGRIFTAIGAILLSRVSWIVDPSLPFHLTDLVGLFVGSIFGILFREILLVLSGSGEVPLPKQSDLIVTQWMIRNPISLKQGSLFFQTPFYFLYWLLILMLCALLQGFGFSFLKGMGLPEFQYLPGISSRVFLSVPTIHYLSISLPILYFFAEERFASSNNKESIKRHLLFGIAIGFLIQLFVTWIQSSYLITFLSSGSNNSIPAGRFPGLFIDSGSSSWLLPTLALTFMIFLYMKVEKTKERIGLFLIFLLFFIVSSLGMHQAKAFWVIWLVNGFVLLIWVLTKKFIIKTKILWIVRVGIFFLLLFMLTFVMWAFSKIDSVAVLQDLGNRFLNFQSALFLSKDISAFKELDKTRFELIQISIENIGKAFWFGNGIGSLPILLRDPSQIGDHFGNIVIDVPPNFILALFHDFGIFGTLFTLMMVILFVWERFTHLGFLLLMVPFLFGLQVQHSDGAFIAMFLLFYPIVDMSGKIRLLRLKNWFRYMVLILAIGIPLHYILLYTQDFPAMGFGADFRREKLGSYQIQAAVFATDLVSDHEFHGNQFEWRLAKETNFRKGQLIIRSEAKDILLEMIWKNKDRVTLLESVIEKSQNGDYVWKGMMPAGSEYVVCRVNRNTVLKINRNFFSREGELKF